MSFAGVFSLRAFYTDQLSHPMEDGKDNEAAQASDCDSFSSAKRSRDIWLGENTKEKRDYGSTGLALKRTKVIKQVRFADSDQVIVDEQEIAWLIESLKDISIPAYNLQKTACEQGWLIESSECTWLNFPPKVSRSISDDDILHFCPRNLVFTKFSFPVGEAVTDLSFCRLFEGRSYMRTIELSQCSNITDISLAAIGRNCPDLRDFSLFRCPKVTDRGIATLVSRCKHLRSISLDLCPKLTDESIYAIAKSCLLLFECSLCKNTQVSLSTFKMLLQSCRWLEKLDLWQCTQITDAWLDTIIQWGDNIKELDVKHCTKITTQGIERLLKHFPNIQLTCDSQ